MGADSVRTSNIHNYARSEQHTHAMNLLEKERASDAGQSLLANAPIALALNTMSHEEKIRLKHKFDIAYFLAIEKLSFHKFPRVCELEARHGVSIGSSYTTETTARSFTHFIAEAKRNQLVSTLQNTKFFSLLLDGSTDAANVDNELLLAVLVWFDKNDLEERVCTKTSYLKISKLPDASATSLFIVLQEALKILGITKINREECAKLIGIATDGASANIAGAGLKGLVEKELPWVFWM